MKLMSVTAAVLALGLVLSGGDADAANRLGGGKSTGMQRQMNVGQTPAPSPVPGAPMASPQAPAKAPLANPASAAQPNKRSWMGPLAGLAAGLGLAALASHFGFGEALASFMTMALLGLLLLAVVGFFLRRRAAQSGAGPSPAWAGAGAGMPSASPATPAWSSPEAPAARTATGSAIGAGVAGSGNSAAAGGLFASLQAGAATPVGQALPAGFDAIGFVRIAKSQFIRLQAANDAANLDELRAVTTPEMFAEFKLELMERNGVAQRTDVLTLEAEVLEVVEEASRHIASVRFSGTIRENQNPAEAFDEIWHLSKFRSGNDGWLLSGIQQTH